MSRQTHDPGVPGWLKVIVYLVIALHAPTWAGHAASGPAPRPITACVELRAVLAGEVS
jgi:hypothetical protein